MKQSTESWQDQIAVITDSIANDRYVPIAAFFQAYTNGSFWPIAALLCNINTSYRFRPQPDGEIVQFNFNVGGKRQAAAVLV